MDKSWSRYFEKHELLGRKPFLTLHPDICIVIPCYNEHNIMTTIQSIIKSAKKKLVQIIVVVNTSESSSNDIVQHNRNTYQELLTFSNTLIGGTVHLLPLLIEGVRKKHAGVGYARKVGMDMACSFFAELKKYHGILVSLDADTVVSQNFIADLEALYHNPKVNLSTHYFEHSFNGLDVDVNIQRAINKYELYLRYYRLALEYVGFPYAIHTVGSSFSLRADLYVRNGGMNRRQGGEDFYFLHKVAPNAVHQSLNTATVYPQARISDRVPFGTGPVIESLSKSDKSDYLVYDLESFKPLKYFFENLELFYSTNSDEWETIMASIPTEIRTFIIDRNLLQKLRLAKANCASLKTFAKQFFQVFDAFEIVKYLNFAHQEYYCKQAVLKVALALYNQMHESSMEINNELELLEHYRYYDKKFA